MTSGSGGWQAIAGSGNPTREQYNPGPGIEEYGPRQRQKKSLGNKIALRMNSRKRRQLKRWMRHHAQS